MKILEKEVLIANLDYLIEISFKLSEALIKQKVKLLYKINII